MTVVKTTMWFFSFLLRNLMRFFKSDFLFLFQRRARKMNLVPIKEKISVKKRPPSGREKNKQKKQRAKATATESPQYLSVQNTFTTTHQMNKKQNKFEWFVRNTMDLTFVHTCICTYVEMPKKLFSLPLSLCVPSSEARLSCHLYIWWED